MRDHPREIPRPRPYYASLVVLSLNFLLLALLLFRDFYLATHVPIGYVTDYYFGALTFINILIQLVSVPVGEVLHKRIGSVRSSELFTIYLNRFISRSIPLALLMVIISVGAFFALSLIVSGSLTTAITPLVPYLLLIVFTSVFVIICNSLLNVFGDQFYVYLCQLVVPAISIVFIQWADPRDVFLAAVQGMFIGQVLNLGLLVYRLRTLGLVVMPEIRWVLDRRVSSHYEFASVFSIGIILFIIPQINYILSMIGAVGALTQWAAASRLPIAASSLVAQVIFAVWIPSLIRTLGKRPLRSISSMVVVVCLSAGISSIIFSSLAFYFFEYFSLVLEDPLLSYNATPIFLVAMKTSIFILPLVAISTILLKFTVLFDINRAVFSVTAYSALVNLLVGIWLSGIYGFDGIIFSWGAGLVTLSLLLLRLFYRNGNIDRYCYTILASFSTIYFIFYAIFTLGINL